MFADLQIEVGNFLPPFIIGHAAVNIGDVSLYCISHIAWNQTAAQDLVEAFSGLPKLTRTLERHA